MRVRHHGLFQAKPFVFKRERRGFRRGVVQQDLAFAIEDGEMKIAAAEAGPQARGLEDNGVRALFDLHRNVRGPLFGPDGERRVLGQNIPGDAHPQHILPQGVNLDHPTVRRQDITPFHSLSLSGEAKSKAGRASQCQGRWFQGVFLPISLAGEWRRSGLRRKGARSRIRMRAGAYRCYR